MVGDGDVADQVPAHPLHRLAEPADRVEHEEREERTDVADHHVVGEGGDERAEREEDGGHEREPEVADEHHRQLRVPVGAKQDAEEPGEGDHEQDEDETSQELPEHDLADAHRGGEQQLVGAGALLLREHPHGDRRYDEDEQHREIVEEGCDHHLVQVEARQHLGVPHHAVDLQRLVEGEEERVEEVAREREVRREQHVGDGRREIGPEFLARDGEDVAHRAPPPSSRPPRWRATRPPSRG